MIKRHGETLIVTLILMLSVLLSVIVGINRHGDDASYYPMTESLLKDGDFILDNKDIGRWGKNKLKIVPYAAYVSVNKKEVMKYAKPVLYPVVAAPFLLLGISGLALLNGLFLGGCISLSYLYLRKYFNQKNSLFISSGFFLGSFMPAYLAWIHPEMMLYFACSLSMWLWLHKNDSRLAALVMGMASYLRIEFFLLFVALAAVLALQRKFKELILALVKSLAGYGFMLAIVYLFLGQFWVYGAGRYFIPGRQGVLSFPTLAEIKSSLIIVHSMFEGSGFNSWGLFFRNMVNFFIGRFTGIIWYAFPAVVCAGIYLLYRRALKKEEKVLGDSLLAAVLLLAVILVICRPLNYFGGKDFVCNRYLTILPCLLFLPGIKEVRNPAKVILLFSLGLIVSWQIIVNEIFIKDGSKRFLAHTVTFPLKYAPLGLAQTESLMAYGNRIEFPGKVFLYLPSGRNSFDGKKIVLIAGQEAVLVRKNGPQSMVLKLDTGNILLSQKLALKNKVSQESLSFYYFRARQPVSIMGIENSTQ